MPKKVFPVDNRKSENHRGILHMMILSFWTKFTQTRYFQLKTEQAVQGLQVFAFCAVNVNSTVVFKHYFDHFERKTGYLLSPGLFLSQNCIKLFKPMCKQPWLVKSWLNFDLNLSFKFLYNFTGQLKRLNLVMVMVKSFDKYHHLFNLSILVPILFFHDWDSRILNIKVL